MSNARAAGVFSLMLLLGSGSAIAQTPTPSTLPNDEVRNIAGEVRLLRQAIESYARNQVRFEILIQRLRLQQEVVTNLSVRLEDTQREIANLGAGVPRTHEQLATVEAQLQQTSNPEQRETLESGAKELRQNAEQQDKQLAALHEREAQMRQSVRVEQGRLDELNRNLDAVFSEASAGRAATTLQ